VTMAIGPDAAACPNPDALSGSLLATAKQNGGLNSGSLAVGRFLSVRNGKTQRSDNVSAAFDFLPLVDLGIAPVPLGGCTIVPFPGGGIGGAVPRGLSAGNVTAATPVGTYPLPVVQSELGEYEITFFPAYPNPAPAAIINDGTVLTPGTTTFSWTGASPIGPGSASVDFPLTFQVTIDAVTSLDRSKPFPVTWTGGTKGGIVNINIQSQASQGIGASLLCRVDATLGKFTIPVALLSALPPSYSASGTPTGAFSIGENWAGSFTAPGIDIGTTQFTDSVDFAPITIK